VVRALETRDYPLIQATVLVTATLTVLVQLLVDLLYPVLDPRVRLTKPSKTAIAAPSPVAEKAVTA
jgi:peptide/nickel transport system permease protein